MRIQESVVVDISPAVLLLFSVLFPHVDERIRMFVRTYVLLRTYDRIITYVRSYLRTIVPTYVLYPTWTGGREGSAYGRRLDSLVQTDPSAAASSTTRNNPPSPMIADCSRRRDDDNDEAHYYKVDHNFSL